MHHHHHSYYHRKYDYWGDYWKWRAIGGAVRLGVYAVTQPRVYTTVYYGGIPYYYCDGVYYHRQGPTYVVVPAPTGAVVSSPPPTYETVTVQQPAPSSTTDSNNVSDSNNVTNNYYYANGTFYEETTDPPSVPTAEQLAAEEQAATEAAKLVTDEQRASAVEYPEDEAMADVEPGELADEFPDENFRIVEPPIGATVSLIPEDAEEKKVGEETYYVYAGTWYKPFYSGDDVVYMVTSAQEGAPAGPEGTPEASDKPQAS